MSCGFPQSLHEKVRILPQIRPQLLPSSISNSSFINHPISCIQGHFAKNVMSSHVQMIMGNGVIMVHLMTLCILHAGISKWRKLKYTAVEWVSYNAEQLLHANTLFLSYTGLCRKLKKYYCRLGSNGITSIPNWIKSNHLFSRQDTYFLRPLIDDNTILE
jgi:hypothetical protein